MESKTGFFKIILGVPLISKEERFNFTKVWNFRKVFSPNLGNQGRSAAISCFATPSACYCCGQELPLVALPQQQAVRLIGSRLKASALTREGKSTKGRWIDETLERLGDGVSSYLKFCVHHFMVTS